ncbi:MAG: beta-N-acetylhexosaminidase [Sphingomonadaceae bacterium]
MIPAFFGLSGPSLTQAERAFFARHPPAGYILFRRNIETPAQVQALTESLRDLAGNPRLPILIDQEGGRVARLPSPPWPAFPAQAVFARVWERAPATAMVAARANAQAIAQTLRSLGITVDCLPVVDVPVAGSHAIIGDRALGEEPLQVAALGRAILDGLQAGGVVGVVKHVPGHGRATADSHLDLPVVTASEAELEADLAPFIRLADAPMAMTAHVLYTAWDRELCASLSPTIIRDIIRGRIGFDGLLMSDDLGMQALGRQPGGNRMAGRALGVLAAGCDIALHCSGDLAEMAEVAAALPAIGQAARRRLEEAMAWAEQPWRGAEAGAEVVSVETLLARRDSLLEAATVA